MWLVWNGVVVDAVELNLCWLVLLVTRQLIRFAAIDFDDASWYTFYSTEIRYGVALFAFDNTYGDVNFY